MPADPENVASLDAARTRHAHHRRTPNPAPGAVDGAAGESGRETATPRTRGMWVGPTSEETRRLVAESRIRQGLPARIDNPAVLESLALFVRNALDTLDHDRKRDQGRWRDAA
ncbi:hypothetical protein NN3_07440 [Nocardia neocaledoniensis NBRC 108232]|uniref:Uncharacterized protein n=1 Tax=Nocardia neocaledoniensis TaxID=236511 RepID=A0A317NEJ7_9NOCA|nr:hypothetical protein [Nocardia neocaledoniensis]PWV73751.1 hypothetical protein DFR69_107382 [Nocardia neocaledoniensis]GEM29737.1 hypothetical protein NN3_07440 [Nocardia neocaledoniensis NBRC 108232]